MISMTARRRKPCPICRQSGKLEIPRKYVAVTPAYTKEKACSLTCRGRYERQNMPTVIRAPSGDSREELYENGVGDTRGYFDDGAYVAAANLGPQRPDYVKVEIDPQEAFTTALKDRFLKQRVQIHSPSQDDGSTTAKKGKLLPPAPTKSNKAYKRWHNLLRTSTPSSTQIRALEQADVLRLLEFIQKHYLVRETEIGSHISTWIWSLLAKLEDVGSMTNDQAWSIRELGKRAILVQLSFTDPAAAKQLELSSAEDAGAGHADVSTMDPSHDSHATEGAISTVPEGAEDPNARQNTLATLDMIIVLVGEVFRQRDLLEFRQSWGIEATN